MIQSHIKHQNLLFAYEDVFHYKTFQKFVKTFHHWIHCKSTICQPGEVLQPRLKSTGRDSYSRDIFWVQCDFKCGAGSVVKWLKLSRVDSLKLLIVNSPPWSAVEQHGKPVLAPSTSGQKLREIPPRSVCLLSDTRCLHNTHTRNTHTHRLTRQDLYIAELDDHRFQPGGHWLSFHYHHRGIP